MYVSRSGLYCQALSIVGCLYCQALSTTQISYFSVTQAEAVTAAQQEEFTNAQLAALQDAGGTVEVDMEVDDDSGNKPMQIFTLAFLWLLFLHVQCLFVQVPLRLPCVWRRWWQLCLGSPSSSQPCSQ